MGNKFICNNSSERKKNIQNQNNSDNSSESKKKTIENNSNQNNNSLNNINQENLNSNNNIKPNNTVSQSNENNSISNYNKKGNKKFAFSGPKSYNLIVHRNDGMNDYVIEMTLTKYDKNKVTKQAEFIMILDVSGSMSAYVHNLVSNIIPRGLNLLNYSDNDRIYLITFQSHVNSYQKTVGELKRDSSIQGGGETYMSGVYRAIESVLNSNGQGKNYRLLVLSDGLIGDQDETVKESERIKQFLKNNNYSISVGSIRYDSGYGQADNTKTKFLTEVSASDPNETISQKIYELFKDDYFESDFSIQSDKIKFRIDPWNEGKNEIKLNEGRNIIFADKNPTAENVGIFENGKLKYTKNDFKNGYKLNYQNYNALLGAKINMTARKVRINKTSGSREALEENKKIINYFENFEKKLEGNENKEAIIATELKTTNELDISKYDNNKLAQFIGVENNIIPINDFLKDYLKMDEKEEDNINEFVGNVLGDGLKIDAAFEKLFKA